MRLVLIHVAETEMRFPCAMRDLLDDVAYKRIMTALEVRDFDWNQVRMARREFRGPDLQVRVGGIGILPCIGDIKC